MNINDLLKEYTIECQKLAAAKSVSDADRQLIRSLYAERAQLGACADAPAQNDADKPILPKGYEQLLSSVFDWPPPILTSTVDAFMENLSPAAVRSESGTVTSVSQPPIQAQISIHWGLSAILIIGADGHRLAGFIRLRSPVKQSNGIEYEVSAAGFQNASQPEITFAGELLILRQSSDEVPTSEEMKTLSVKGSLYEGTKAPREVSFRAFA